MPADGVERRVLAVAAGQHGAVSLAQLREAGLGRHRVAHLVSKGWLRRRHYGVYLVGPLETPLTRATAAVLAYAPRGVLSHHSAAVLWGVCPPPFRRIHVTVATASGVHSRPGVQVIAAGISILPTSPSAKGFRSPQPRAPSSTWRPTSPIGNSRGPPSRHKSSGS